MPKGRFAEDLSGRRFTRLTVIHLHDNIRHRPRWLCVCDCGGRVHAYANHLKSGNVRSCGCLLVDITRKRCLTHGESGAGNRSKQSPEYKAWARMRERVTPSSAKYKKLYADRGITLCERWKSFELFLEDMGRMPAANMQLDRKNNDLGYAPDNVRWATPLEQQRNKRQNIRLTIEGETLYLAEWSERSGIKADTIYARLRKGWSVERAVSEKPRAK